jgi:hypothetical protein
MLGIETAAEPEPQGRDRRHSAGDELKPLPSAPHIGTPQKMSPAAAVEAISDSTIPSTTRS